MRKKKPSRSSNKVKLTPKLVAASVRYGLEWLTNATIIVLSEREKQFAEDDPRLQKVQQARKEIDQELGRSLPDHMMIQHLAKSTEDWMLFMEALSGALIGGEHLPGLLTRFEKEFAEPADFDPESPDTLYFHYAQLVLSLVEYLEKLSEKHPERFRLLARDMPCWPFRVFRHRKAYGKRFDRIADKLHLGETCPIHSSKVAEYSFEKPINAFVFEVLSEFLRVHGFLNSRKDESAEKRLTAAGITPDKQAPFLNAHALPRLKKGQVAKDWAEKAIIPYLEAEYPDWNGVPVLKDFLGKAGGKAKAKEAIKGALESMAWPD